MERPVRIYRHSVTVPAGRLVGAIACTVLLLAATLLIEGPAAAHAGQHRQGAKVSKKRTAGQWRASLTFAKNRKSPANSAMTWRLAKRTPDGSWELTEEQSWRAGSGMLGKRGRDECIRSTGWLPNGTYTARQYDDYPGNLIHGRAFRLSNKRCRNGTVRQNLFLHSEQGPGNHQCRDTRGDQACRWEYPRHNDYKSWGCIKMAPGDLKEAVDLFQRHFRSGVTYPKSRFVLRVVG